MEHGRFGHNDKDTMCDITSTTLVFFWNFERALLHGPYRRATAATTARGSSGSSKPVEIEQYSSKEWRFKFAVRPDVQDLCVKDFGMAAWHVELPWCLGDVQS